MTSNEDGNLTKNEIQVMAKSQENYSQVKVYYQNGEVIKTEPLNDISEPNIDRVLDISEYELELSTEG